MRIIAGKWRGQPLIAPEGNITRPTSDRAREGLFSMLASRIGSFEGLYIADLFAGTGALGLEALSRGAAHCTFVENNADAVAAIRHNIERFSAAACTDIHMQAIEYAQPPARPYDIIFLDPPYGKEYAAMALARICNSAWVAPKGWISVETNGEKLNMAAGFETVAERRFGKAHILLLHKE